VETIQDGQDLAAQVLFGFDVHVGDALES
jgi:hypothetical protein